MSEKLFHKIIDEIAEMKFKGRLSFHFYNEPLLDKRIFKFISYSRKKLVSANLVLFTNGDLLTKSSVEKLIISGIDTIRISFHNKQIKDKLEKLINTLPSKSQNKFELYDYFNGKEPLYTRAGLIEVPNNFLVHDFSKGCYMAAFIVINFEGKVVLCCNDYYGEKILGDCNKNDIKTIWKKTQHIRKDIYTGNYKYRICKTCANSEGQKD